MSVATRSKQYWEIALFLSIDECGWVITRKKKKKGKVTGLQQM